MEEKFILGIKHIKVMCIECKGMCWAQPMSTIAKGHYRCHTCTEPKELGVGRFLDPMKDMRFD